MNKISQRRSSPDESPSKKRLQFRTTDRDGPPRLVAAGLLNVAPPLDAAPPHRGDLTTLHIEDSFCRPILLVGNAFVCRRHPS